jgi:glucosamine--fructose-6-phosphate aminotransferase (isomerizing)
MTEERKSMAETQETQVTGLYRSIHAQPQAVRDLLADGEGPALAAEQLAGADRIFISGIGTSFHAATVGEYLLRYAGADAWAVRSFEFVHYPRPLRKGEAVIVISHRGSKLHGTLAVERARESGGVTIGITGQNSKMQDLQFMLKTVEQDPSSTHSISYTGALMRLAQLAAQLAALRGNTEQAHRLERGLQQIPGLMEDILGREDEVRHVAKEAVAHNRRLYYLGAGPNSVTGPEGALKAKEAAYVTAEGFELEQGIHGPQVAFEQEDLVIPISVQGPAQSRMADLLLALREIGSRVWLIGEAPSPETAALFDNERWRAFSLGAYQSLPEELTPMLTVLPLQLLAEFLAAERGTNADSFRADQEPYKRAGQRFRI